jgi:hypothetical protein
VAAVTSAEREEAAAFRRVTSTSAAGIAREGAPSTGKLARAARGLGKVAKVGLVAAQVVGPILDTINALEQIDAAKALIDDLAKQRDEAEAGWWRDQGYEPVYRNGKIVDYVKAPQPPKPDPAPSKPATTGTVYSLRGQKLIGQQVPLTAEHLPITFMSLTDEGAGIWDLSHPTRRWVTGYALRRDHARLKSLARSQSDLIRLTQPWGSGTTSSKDTTKPPVAARGRLEIDFSWREGTTENLIEAVCDNTYSADGSWVATTKGSLDELREFTERTSSDIPPDYEIFVNYFAADGSDSYLHQVQSASGASFVEEGKVPDGVLDPDKYPGDSAVSFIIQNYLLD